MLASATKTKFENITNLTTDNIPPRLANAVLSVAEIKHIKTKEMIHWSIKFWNVKTGKKEYREYPKTAQFETREKLCKFLQNRKFLAEDYIVDEIKEFDPIKDKMKLADAWGKLIYDSR